MNAKIANAIERSIERSIRKWRAAKPQVASCAGASPAEQKERQQKKPSNLLTECFDWSFYKAMARLSSTSLGDPVRDMQRAPNFSKQDG